MTEVGGQRGEQQDTPGHYLRPLMQVGSPSLLGRFLLPGKGRRLIGQAVEAGSALGSVGSCPVSQQIECPKCNLEVVLLMDVRREGCQGGRA